MVFATAFIAGAIAAVGINRALDVHLAQAKPKVECEPIFVAIRSLPPGTPVTIWDVALRDWPKAMLPSTALRAHDQFEGMILRHPVREGQPLLSVQLAQADAATAPAAEPAAMPIARVAQTTGPAAVATAPAVSAQLPPAAAVEADLWSSTAEPVAVPEPALQHAPPAHSPPASTTAVVTPPVGATPVVGEPTIAEPVIEETPVATAPAEEVSVVTGPPVDAPVVPSPTESTPAPAKVIVRYLVVPERIAMQADNSFVAPATTAALAAAAASEAAAAKATTAAPPAPKTSVPPVAQHPGNRRPVSTSQAGKTSQQSKRNAQAAKPQSRPQPAANQRQAVPESTTAPQQKVSDEQGAAKRSPGMFGSMFPNLRAGIEAVEAEMENIRRGRPEPTDPPAERRKASPQPPSQSAAGWPKFGKSPARAF